MAFPASAQEEMTKQIKKLDREASDLRYRARANIRDAEELEAKAALADQKRRQYELAVSILNGETMEAVTERALISN